MATIGNITVPAPSASGTFPLVSDWGFGRARSPQVVTHSFGSANNKIEQRFYLGNGLTRYTFRRAGLTNSQRQSLQDFWEARQGAYQPFTYNVPNEDGSGTTATTVRFDVAPLSFEHLSNAICSTGVTLIEVPSSIPSYSVSSTVERFPSGALETALLAQAQTIIPLIKITVAEAGASPAYPLIYLSDRACTVGGQSYEPRLLRWDGISQVMVAYAQATADQATFVFGNADKVMRDLASDPTNGTDLRRAQIEFSLYHVGSQIKLDLWTGEVIDWRYDSGPEFQLIASDGIYELGLDYPPRDIRRDCWKEFDDGVNCPYTAQGSGGDADTCDKSFDPLKVGSLPVLPHGDYPVGAQVLLTADGRKYSNVSETWTDIGEALGCGSHSMETYFGGIVVKPQAIRIKDNTTGLWGMGRNLITSVSMAGESVYGRPLQEIYTDEGMAVTCQVAAGREEGEFYDFLGIVGAGPLGAYVIDGLKHRVDGQAPHGPLPLGLRRSLGHDPVQDNDPDADSDEFGLGQGTPTTYPDATKAAGVAFIELRRSDKEGRQLTRTDEHSMTAWVLAGLGGWVWDAAGDRSATTTLTNPVWIAVNMLLKAKGLFGDPSDAGSIAEADQEAVFDWEAAESAAGICNDLVDKIIGTGTETQFKFSGVLADRRPLRDWLRNILVNCVGYFVQSNGKLKIGTRVNSSTVQAFTEGNIIYGSLQLSRHAPAYNHLTVNFANSLYEWKPDSIGFGDIDHAKIIGGGVPQWNKSQLNLSGVSGRSQAARIQITRLREELGGYNAAQWKAARDATWQTTILALAVEPGAVVSITDDEVPGGVAEFRVQRWTLNSDYSITLDGTPSTDEMYDYIVGPKPEDVEPDPVPAERIDDVLPIQPWFPYKEQPDAADPLLDETDWQFWLGQIYEDGADGTPTAKLRIEGAFPITQHVTQSAPRVGTYSIADTGGTIPSGSFVTLFLVATDADGKPSRNSQPTAILCDIGTATNKIVLSDITWPDGTTGYRLYASYDHHLVSLQASGAQASSLELTAIDNERTQGPPQEDLKTLRVRVKEGFHTGVVGIAITEVATGEIRVEGLNWVTDEWAGRQVAVVADESDGSAPVWNFLVSANDSDTLTVSPDPYALGVHPNDVLIIRTKPDVFSTTTIGDSKFINSQFPDGANVDEEIGRLVRIIDGTGVGQVRRIISNTSTVMTIEGEWETTPDATSIFIIEQAAWEYEADVRDLTNSIEDGIISFDVPIANLIGKTMIVEVATVSRHGQEPQRKYNAWRGIYLYGKYGGTRYPAVFGTDGPLIIDTDVGYRRPIFEYEEGIPLTCKVVAKTIISQAIFDIQYSSDEGATWASIFWEGGATVNEFKPTLDVGSDVVVMVTGFDPDIEFAPGDWLRQDLIQGAGEDAVIVVEFGVPYGLEGELDFSDPMQSGEKIVVLI